MANDCTIEVNNAKGGGEEAIVAKALDQMPHIQAASNPRKNYTHTVHHPTPAPHLTTNTDQIHQSHPVTRLWLLLVIVGDKDEGLIKLWTYLVALILEFLNCMKTLIQEYI